MLHNLDTHPPPLTVSTNILNVFDSNVACTHLFLFCSAQALETGHSFIMIFFLGVDGIFSERQMGRGVGGGGTHFCIFRVGAKGNVIYKLITLL